MRAFDLKFLERLGERGLFVGSMNNAVHSRRGSRDSDYLPRQQFTLTLGHAQNMGHFTRFAESAKGA
jgi:hypothetical protein